MIKGMESMASLSSLRTPTGVSLPQGPGQQTPAEKLARAKEVAEGFESLFVHQMLEPLEKSGEVFFGEGAAGRTFSGLFRQIMADEISKSRPLGIANQIEQALEGTMGAGEAPAKMPIMPENGNLMTNQRREPQG